jgi:UDPglucose--hexose-1-phosphate uridylyltransferase
MSEIRYNHLDDAYVIIAPERLHRPDYMAWNSEVPTENDCPFCEGNETLTPGELFAIRDKGGATDSGGWHTRVVPNLYKAVQIEAPNRSHSEGVHSVWEGFGAHEVIIDTPRHHASMQEWTTQEYYNWLVTMKSRLRDLRGDSRIAHIALFKNHGMGAGATQSHPHTQVVALPVVPKSVVRLLERNYAHYREHGRGIVEDIVAQEERDAKRIVSSNGAFLAFCPFASAYPFEVMVVSRELFSSLEQIDEDRMQQLSSLLHDLFKRMAVQLGNFDFNLTVSTPPMHKSFDTAQLHDLIDPMCRFNIRIMPRIYRHGGFELSTGTMINPVAPERSAELLREGSK